MLFNHHLANKQLSESLSDASKKKVTKEVLALNGMKDAQCDIMHLNLSEKLLSKLRRANV